MSGLRLGPQLRRRLKTTLKRRFKPRGNNVERFGDIAITRITRISHRQPVARIEQREKRQLKPRRGAAGDDDTGWINLHAIIASVMTGDPLSEGLQPQSGRIAQRML